MCNNSQDYELLWFSSLSLYCFGSFASGVSLRRLRRQQVRSWQSEGSRLYYLPGAAESAAGGKIRKP